MVCHTCCEEAPLPRVCPTCSAPALRFLGVGSERVEETLRTLLPDSRVARMDSDTMLRREDYEATLGAFAEGELDILVGTQMIAKGLDFPKVTTVGVVNADSALHLPDFRAAERTFQLISQVAGRAGRGELDGRIVVQSMTPDHPAIAMAAKHDFEGFAKLELADREQAGYPPVCRLLRAVVEDEDEGRVKGMSWRIAESLRAALQAEEAGVLGPAPAPMSMVRGRHRHMVLVKVPSTGRAMGIARGTLVELAAEATRPRVAIDVDPVSLL